MTQFCEECPLKGESDRDISAIYVKDVYSTDTLRRRNLLGRFAVAIDERGKPSDPISYSPRFTSDVIAKELPQRIDHCEEPRITGFAFFKRNQCGAFNEEIVEYDSTPAAFIESKEHFIDRIIRKHSNITGQE